MTTRARQTRRERAARRAELRTVLTYLVVVILFSLVGVGIERWINQ